MCGIAGLLDLEQRPLEGSLLATMATILAHRGPDGEGFAQLGVRPADCVLRTRESLQQPLAGPAAFAHRRLAILDLSPAGAQPWASPDRSLWLTYNGEIFNYRELQEELRTKHAAKTSQPGSRHPATGHENPDQI